jgi:hypothetical protein
MTKPHLPKFFYEILPLLYAMVGVLGLHLTRGNALGLISSLAILAATAGIGLLRWRHRKGRCRKDPSTRIADSYSIPDFIHEKIPLFCAIAGVAGLYFAGRTVVGLLGGLVLLSAAGAIWFLRRNHRFSLDREDRLQRIRAFKLRQEKCDRDESYRKCHRCDPEFSHRCDRPWATGKAGRMRMKNYG